jgi:hypothetical protein
METYPPNYPTILAANIGYQYALEYSINLANFSKSVNQSARGRLKAD